MSSFQLICLSLVVIIILIILWLCFAGSTQTNTQIGGSREAIFSRFHYLPSPNFISQFDTIDYDRFSKVYSQLDNLKFIVARPYSLAHGAKPFQSSQPSINNQPTEQEPSIWGNRPTTWLETWQFPIPLDQPCLQKVINHCHEPVFSLKTDEDKLSGLSVDTPPDLQHVSPCFEQTWLNWCTGQSSPGGTKSPHNPLSTGYSSLFL